MGVSLFDRVTNEIVFDVNFWHYRAIVEAIRRLAVLPESKVDSLNLSWQETGLKVEEARRVAEAIRSRLLPTLSDEERLLFDGGRTTEPDDGKMHYDAAEMHKNYSTNRRVLEQFARCCETGNGFWVC